MRDLRGAIEAGTIDGTAARLRTERRQLREEDG
jgi:hypothetical protein